MESLISLVKHQSKGKNIFSEVLIAIIVFIFSSIMSSVIFIPIYKIMKSIITSQDLNKIIVIASLYSTIGMIITVIIFCTLIEKRSLESMGFRRQDIINNYIKGLIYGLVLFSIAFFISTVLGGTKVLGINNEIDFKILLLIFLGFIIQGMSEEVFCRGYLMLSISRENSVAKAVIFNSLFFSLLHTFNDGINLISLINIFLVGVMFSLFMLKYNNIYIIGAMHSMWNFAQGNIFGGKVSGIELNETIILTSQNPGKELLSGGLFGIEGSIATTIVLIGSIFIILQVKNKKNKI